ncbi:MAG TPA: lysophospholipid acyltransferase family protein [Longimicrobiales bacterium]|nr:lysophospholipid acyltransferase family protein [Longimicrobiales bacterium]
MKEIGFRAAGILGHGLLGSLFTTTRARRLGEEHYLRFRREGRPVIFVFWHGQLLPLVHYHRNEGVVVLVSEHADGEYVARVIERHGFRTVRGSSTTGGIRGLKGLIRAAREGHDLALTPDGPRGPRHRFKAGALVAAQVTGAPIIPVAAGASASWHFDSWDRFMVPRPLSKVAIEYGPPVFVPRETSQEEREETSRSLEAALDTLTARVDRAAPDGVWVRQEDPVVRTGEGRRR